MGLNLALGDSNNRCRIVLRRCVEGGEEGEGEKGRRRAAASTDSEVGSGLHGLPVCQTASD